jgi:hypothetical protein
MKWLRAVIAASGIALSMSVVHAVAAPTTAVAGTVSAIVGHTGTGNYCNNCQWDPVNGYWCSQGEPIGYWGYLDCFGPMITTLPCDMYEGGICWFDDNLQVDDDALDGSRLVPSVLTGAARFRAEATVGKLLSQAKPVDGVAEARTCDKTIAARRYEPDAAAKARHASSALTL